MIAGAVERRPGSWNWRANTGALKMAPITRWMSARAKTVVAFAIPSRPPFWAFCVAPYKEKRGPGCAANHAPGIAPVPPSWPKWAAVPGTSFA